jgi:hypothetical protein
MKKISFLTLFIFAFQTSFGQKGFNFGLNIAPIISSTRWDSSKKELKSAENKSRMGFKGGLMVGYGFAENVGIQTGLDILMVGFSQKIKSVTPNPTNKYSLTAVEIPLLLKMRTNDLASGIHAKGYFGGALGLNVGAKVDASVDQTPLYEKGKNTITNHFQPFYTWFAFGAGIDWDIEGVGMLDIALIYNLGLSNIIKPNHEVEGQVSGTTVKFKPYENLRARLSYIGLNIGFWFPMGGN